MDSDTFAATTNSTREPARQACFVAISAEFGAVQLVYSSSDLPVEKKTALTNQTKTPIPLSQVESKEIIAGFNGRFIHSENMTFAYWTIAKDAALPEHSHHHEQVVNMLEGEFELTVDGQPHRLMPGDVVIIPGGVSHSGRAISDSRILDVFQPPRDDYR